MSKSSIFPFGRLGDQQIRTSPFEPWSSQTNELNIYTCRFPARHSALLDGKDWLAQYQDNGTKWDTKRWCLWPGLPVGQHYKVATCVQCHTSVPNVMTLNVARS